MSFVPLLMFTKICLDFNETYSLFSNKNKIMQNIKNFDKLKTERDREFVKAWSKITTITINDDGFYILDMIPAPAFSDTLIKTKKNKK